MTFIVVGGGGAGLRAAIAIAEEHSDLDVAIVSKVYPMRSHTVSAEGGAAGVIMENDSFEDHIYDTISGGDWLCDQEAVEMFVHQSPKELIQLEHWGCPWSREPDGKIAVRPFGGMKIERTWFAADKVGFHMLHTLFQTSLKYKGIKRYDEWFVTRLLVEDRPLPRRRGDRSAQRAGAFDRSQRRGDLHRGRRANLPFHDQRGDQDGRRHGGRLPRRSAPERHGIRPIPSHRTPGDGHTESPRRCGGKGGILVNKDGYRYLQDYDLGEPVDIHDPRHPVKRTMELGPRDRCSMAFIKEREKGRTIPGPYGDVVHLDIRHLGEKRINEKLPFARELARNYIGIDPVHEPIPVRPVVHYMMGGIDTDINGATELPGLFAAGETACVSINGANRLGSNSLSELLVFGARGGAFSRPVRQGESRPPHDRPRAPGRRRAEAYRRDLHPQARRHRTDCLTAARDGGDHGRLRRHLPG